MQVTVEQSSPCTVILNVEIDQEQVSRTFESTYRQFSRFTNVPGFRPGKAPRALVERYVDKSRVKQQAMERIIRETFQEALSEQSITPLRGRDPELDGNPEINDREPFTYRAIVSLEPEVALGAYTGLTVTRPVMEVTDEVIDKHIETLRERAAKLEVVTDRGVEPGDQLSAENRVIFEGEEPDDQPVRRQLIRLGSNIPGFDEAIMGMTVGEERTFTLTFPEDYHEEDRRGKTATFHVKVTAIRARVLPALDDDFAMSVTGAETVAEMRELEAAKLREQNKELSDQLAEQQLIAQIINNSTINFPEVLVRDEVQDEFRNLAQELRKQNVSYAQFLEVNGLTPETHQEQSLKAAAVRIAALLALRDISVQENLQPSEAEVNAEFEKLLSAGTITDDQYDEFVVDTRRRIQLANALVQRRLHDFLFANNTIVDKQVDDLPNPEDTEIELANEISQAGETEKSAEPVKETEQEETETASQE